MKKIYLFSLIALLTVSCSKEDDPKPVFTLSATTLSFETTTADQQLTITANVEWTAAVTTGSDWCTISPASGNGNGAITVNAKANTGLEQRNATVTLSPKGMATQTVSVTQNGVAAAFSVSPTTLNFNDGVETKTITITSNVTWAVSKSGADHSWCKLSDNGNSTLSVTSTANTSTTSRTADIVFTPTGKTAVTVKATQAGITARKADSLVLVKFYDDNDGINWTTKWNLTKPMNTWNGITLNAQGRVEKLAPTSNNISGALPESLFNLSELVELNLYGNKISGTISSNVSKLTKLTAFYVGNNQLTGTFPASMGDMAALKRIDVGHNKLSGTVDANLGKLTPETIIINYNALSGELPASWLATADPHLCPQYTEPGGSTAVDAPFSNAKPCNLIFTIDNNAFTVSRVPGAAKTVQLTSNVTWTASIDVPWCMISPTSGSSAGNKTITITMDTNGTYAIRTGTITLTPAYGGTPVKIFITQLGI